MSNTQYQRLLICPPAGRSAQAPWTARSVTAEHGSHALLPGLVERHV
jgi:hypothetical protein